MTDGAYTITMTASGTDTVTMANSVAATDVVTDYIIHARAELDYGKYTLKAVNKTSTDVTLELYNLDGKLLKT